MEYQAGCESFSDMALRYLREQIINGKLFPQERIVESAIAKQLGVSRGPVRDALKQLAVEGLVDYEPNKGCSVALLSPKDAYEVFFLRGSLEKLALEKSGGHIDDRGIFIMEEALDEMRAAAALESTLRMVDADEIFHRQIVLSGQVDRLVKMWELLSPLNGAMFLTVKAANEVEERLGIMPYVSLRGNDLDSHQQLLDAIKSGALAETLRELDTHYIKNGERIYRLSLRVQPPRQAP